MLSVTVSGWSTLMYPLITHAAFLCVISLEPMKGSQGKKGSSNNMGGKNPLANSMAHHSSNMATGKNANPGTSHMDQRGAKLFEIYSSGKSSGGVTGTQTGGHVASNISNGSGGSQGH